MALSRMKASSVRWMVSCTPGICRSLAKRGFLGAPRLMRSSFSAVSSSIFTSSPLLRAGRMTRSTSLSQSLTIFSCWRTTFLTRGFSSVNWWVDLSTAPEMISGVRASSISTESTSSTMAKWKSRCTRCSGCITMLSRR